MNNEIRIDVDRLSVRSFYNINYFVFEIDKYRPPEITFSLKYRGYGGKEGNSKLFLRVSNFWVNRLRVSSFRMIRRIFRKKIGKTWWKIKHAYELCVIEPACSSIVLNSLAMSRSKEHVVHTYTNVKRLV